MSSSTNDYVEKLRYLVLHVHNILLKNDFKSSLDATKLDIFKIAKGIGDKYHLKYTYNTILIFINIVVKKHNDVLIQAENGEIKLDQDFPVNLNKDIIGNKVDGFQNKNNFDESLRNFINQIQVHIINYLGTSFPPNHLQVQTEHLEEKAQRIDEHPSSSYSMVPLSLTPSRTTTLKKNLGSNASGNMFQRTNTLQSLNLPGESSNNQNLKRSLNDPNLGYIPKLMKHTHFQNTNAESRMLGPPDSASRDFNTPHPTIDPPPRQLSSTAQSTAQRQLMLSDPRFLELLNEIQRPP